MLVLSRQVNESVVLGDCVRLRVVLIRHDYVDVYVDAPKGFRVAKLSDSQNFSSQAVISLEKGDSFLITTLGSRMEQGSEHIGWRYDDEARCVLIDIRGEKVRLGIEAPREMAIHRAEISEGM